MVEELSKAEYTRVLPLIEEAQPDYFDVIARAVIAGNSPGTVWVDDAAQPQSMLIRDKQYCYYLAGNADNTAFNAGLRNLLTEQIAPEALASGTGIFKLFYSSSGWESKAKSIFEAASLTRRERSLFTLHSPKLPDRRANLPPFVTVRPIDAELLGSTDLGNLQQVTNEIHSTWASLDDFLSIGFGYCLLIGEQIACWCTAEYVEGATTGVGIETVEEHWGRGFATLAAAAFVEHCVARGITPYWDAWKSNLASHAVAENVGFKRLRDYTIYLGDFKNA